MSTVKVINIQNEEVGEVQLNPDLFDVEIKEYLLHDVVKMQLAARRAGTASTKTRVEVSGGGRKPWRQKGTGRARAGSRTSPLWRGGGTVFGPKPRDYSFKLNKKVKKQALAVALSAKKAEGQLIVLDAFPIDEIKTKNFISTMSTINVSSGLIVIDAPNDYLVKSARNTVQYKILPVEGVNVYDILLHNHLVLIKPALNGLEKRVLS